jgi:hypothetical protein
LSACTTAPPKPSHLTEVKVATPAECTQAHFASYPTMLSLLPAGFGVLVIEEQARALVANKAADASLFGTLLANALRCAPEK